MTENRPEKDHHLTNSAEYFDQYWRYASTLRNWFVVYGIGGIVFLFSDKADIFNKLGTKNRTVIIISFAVAIFAQVILSFFNKWIHWCIYRGKEYKEFKNNPLYKAADKLSSCAWIDVITDLISLVAFVIATYGLIHGLVSN